MSNVPTIPDFAPTTESMANALRSMKVAVEGLLGQSEETGSTPHVYASPVAPRQNIGVTLDVGDIWVDTANKKTLWWDGNGWIEFGAQVSADQIDEIAAQVSDEFVASANAVLATAVSARDLALQAQVDAEAASAEADAYRLQAESARDAALDYRSQAQAARDQAGVSAANAAAAEQGAASAVAQAVIDSTAARNAAQAAQAAALASATAASGSASAAQGSANSASVSATNAGSSATAASASANAAQTQAANASTSASQAATSATNAAGSASSAATSATTAAQSATNAANSATAASTSATTAATRATEAAQSASASQTSATNAATSAGAASTSASQAATSATGAAGSASSAAASQALAATLSSRGVSVITDQFLATQSTNNWQRWQTGGTLTLAGNEVYPLGQSWDFNITAASQRAGLWTTANATQWRGAKNADAYFVEVEFTLVSGTLDGAGILFDWINSASTVFRSQKTLTEMLGGPVALNTVIVAGGVFIRPPGFTGTFGNHIVYAIANDAPFTTAVKRIKFHRVSIRVATAEEQAKGTIGTAFSLVDARLNNDFYTIAEADQAIASATTALQSTLVNQITATNANLTNNYLTSTQTNAAISSATTALKTQLESPTGSIGQLSATLTNDYYTATQTDSAISSATNALKSTLESPSGSIGQINANLTSNYFTSAQTNAAISSATTALKAQLEGPSGSIGLINAALENDYYTIADTNSAIAAESNTLRALVRDSFTPSDFTQDGTYWTQAINATPGAAANLGSPFTFVNVSTLGRSVRIAAPQAAAQIITPKEALSNIPGKSYRVTIRARHNNAFAGNSQAALRFGLRPLNTSYAGTTNLSLTTLTFTAANTNETFTFEVTTTGTTAFVRPFLEVLNTNFGTTGPTIDISMFEMVDSSAAASVQSNVTATLNTNHYTRAQTDSAISSSITTYNAQLIAPTGALGSLSANLTTNYYTKTAADTAIATAVNTFDATVVDGIRAQVDSQQTAIATLEGNASATVSFRAVAGSAGAELELVSASNPSGSVSTARISAGNIILDGTVQRIKLATGAVSDLVYIFDNPVYTDSTTANYDSWRPLTAFLFDFGGTDQTTPERAVVDMNVTLDSLSHTAPGPSGPVAVDWGYTVSILVDVLRRNRSTGAETLILTVQTDLYDIGFRNALVRRVFAADLEPELRAVLLRGTSYFVGEDVVLRYYWRKTRTTTSGSLAVQLKNARASMIKFFR